MEKYVWSYRADNPYRTGTIAGEMHGDVIRDVLKALVGPGYLPVPTKACTKTYAEYKCFAPKGKADVFVVMRLLST